VSLSLILNILGRVSHFFPFFIFIMSAVSSYNPGTELSSIDFGGMIGGPLNAVIEAQAKAALSSVDFIKSVGFDEEKNPIYASFKYPKEVSPYQAGNKGQIISIAITSAGSGYTSAPTVTITGGEGAGATATAEVSDGKLTSITIANAGSGYTGAPTIEITGGEGTGATATATVGTADPVPAQYQEMKMEVPLLTMLPIPFVRIDEATIDFNAKINSMESQSSSNSFGIKGSLEVKQRWLGGSAKLKVSASYKRKSQQGSTVEKTYTMAVHVKAVQDEMPAGMEKVLGILEDAMKFTPVEAPAS
jgi:hypothetical protein